MRTQRISTRLFIVVLTLSLAVLLIRTAAATVLKTFVIANPSFEQYKQLHARYSSTLACPCRHVSNPYKSFVSINYTLHEVCSSVFVTKQWITFMAVNGEKFRLVVDFRVAGIYTFEALSSLCALIHGYIAINLEQFYSSTYVSAIVTPVDTMEVLSQTLIEQFKSSTKRTFVSSLSLTSVVIESNTVPLYMATYFMDSFDQSILGFPSWRNFSGECDCSTGNTCLLQSAIYQHNSLSSPRAVPGFYTACSVLDSLRFSSLKCLYSQACLTDLQAYMESELDANFTALNPSPSSHFQPDATIGSILDQLMVEQWTNSTTYDGYYAACKPSECRYTLTTKNDAIYIVTTIVGLTGGLVTVLKFLIPRLVFLVDKYMQHRMVHIVNRIGGGKANTGRVAPGTRVEDC